MPRIPQYIKDREENRKIKTKKVIHHFEEEDDLEEDEDEASELLAKRSKKYLGKASDKILKMIENKEEDGAVILIQRAMLSSTINLLSTAENNVLESEGSKGIYSFNALVSQVRELISDIQNSQDTALIADSITLLVKKHLRNIAQAIVDQHHSLKVDIEAQIQDKEKVDVIRKKVDNTSKELASYLNDISNLLSENIRERIVD